MTKENFVKYLATEVLNPKDILTIDAGACFGEGPDIMSIFCFK